MGIQYSFWQDEEMWLGYLLEFPDYLSQGVSLKELKINLKDLYEDLTNGKIPVVRRVAELEIV